MPRVGNRHFSYTKSGKAAAKRAQRRKKAGGKGRGATPNRSKALRKRMKKRGAI